MLLTLNIAPGVMFQATSASIGLSDKAADELRRTLAVDEGSDFIWTNVRAASERLAQMTPANQRIC